MLRAILPPKETTMSEQYLLFEAQVRSWVEPLWRQMNPQTRKQVTAALAEMALAKLNKIPRHQAKESSDES